MTLQQIQALTDDEIRVRVAELIGWTKRREVEADYWVWDSPHGTLMGQSMLPNYPADLNACHEIAMSLDRDSLQYSAYCSAVNQIIAITNSAKNARPIQAIDATARARCEAFLAVMQAGNGEGGEG